MKSRNKILFIVAICLITIFSLETVNAKENSGTYYTNNNGVSFTEYEYDLFTKMYWEGYPEKMTKQDYQEFVDNNLLEGTFQSKVVYDNQNNIIARGPSYSTPAKSIKIASLCSDTCRISVVLNWLTNPTIRSYDVMGAYLDGVSLKSNPTTRVASQSTEFLASNIRKEANGFGVSFKLPSGSGIVVNQDFYTSKGGTIYASYQHAKSNTTLATSQLFNLSRIGYGRVFLFYGAATNVYDGMNGVDINV